MKSEQAMNEARLKYYRMSNMWKELARDSNVTLGIGLLFFVMFYQMAVLSYKKQKRAYEDQLKIEKAEAEEKRKMKELERGMAGLEPGDDEDEEGKQGEENPYMKMAQQFMKSGARVRRAQNTRLSQYLERGVDVKFTDVAGLGKIRLELEEIVKFFTRGNLPQARCQNSRYTPHFILLANRIQFLVLNLRDVMLYVFIRRYTALWSPGSGKDVVGKSSCW